MQSGALRSRAVIAAGTLALLASLGQLFASSPEDPAIQRVVSRFNTIAPPPYRAFRRLEGGLTGSPRQGWLEVWTEYVPGRGFSYEVVSEGGHEYVRNKVLRNLLDSEQDLLARGKPLRASFVSNNYTFADGGLTENGLRKIVLTAARKSDGIVNGSLFVEPEAGSLVRLEGRLLKSPSFWIRDVDVAWKYANIAGHDLPVEMTSSGRVRLFGRSSFKMVYDYVSIDGLPVRAGLTAGLRNDRQ